MPVCQLEMCLCRDSPVRRESVAMCHVVSACHRVFTVWYWVVFPCQVVLFDRLESE